MSMETTVLLRSLLFQAKRAKSLDDIISAIAVMCSKEDIATVNDQIANGEKSADKNE